MVFCDSQLLMNKVSQFCTSIEQVQNMTNSLLSYFVAATSSKDAGATESRSWLENPQLNQRQEFYPSFLHIFSVAPDFILHQVSVCSML